ncbi:MAG TPA: phosphoribosylglycinamide formyltransferase [Clostridia bacterium]|nr:phosphoribosylglycinamide formyltransferase [Clostridia bacterium]
MLRVVVLVSGGGTNLQALIDAQNKGILGNARIVKVISSNQNAYALKRAKTAKIETVAVERKNFENNILFEKTLINEIVKCNASLIVLAGFMSILSPDFIQQFRGMIINVHPSLIPSFCGKGYYGLKVHEAALEKGVKITGATVHLVNEIPDGGEIILQKAVEVLDDDTPTTLQKRVMAQAEWVILPKAVAMIAKNKENK